MISGSRNIPGSNPGQGPLKIGINKKSTPATPKTPPKRWRNWINQHVKNLVTHGISWWIFCWHNLSWHNFRVFDSFDFRVCNVKLEQSTKPSHIGCCTTIRRNWSHRKLSPFIAKHVDVSKNRGGPPKSSVLIGFFIINNHPFWE